MSYLGYLSSEIKAELENFRQPTTVSRYVLSRQIQPTGYLEQLPPRLYQEIEKRRISCPYDVEVSFQTYKNRPMGILKLDYTNIDIYIIFWSEYSDKGMKHALEELVDNIIKRQKYMNEYGARANMWVNEGQLKYYSKQDVLNFSDWRAKKTFQIEICLELINALHQIAERL